MKNFDVATEEIAGTQEKVLIEHSVIGGMSKQELIEELDRYKGQGLTETQAARSMIESPGFYTLPKEKK